MNSTDLVPTHVRESEQEQYLYDHVAPSLSELDLEIVRALPEGGNWRDLPPSTTAKSSRLSRIVSSGGRTTYYGRLRWDAPSYTLNTYFYRPGNGSFVHPSQDRMITLREGARLQSFPDEYRFLGGMVSVCRQIGNAVPPLLALAVGSMFPRGRVVDLFCGAGGLSTGLEWAGHEVVLACDKERMMCSTYSLNHPHTTIVRADLGTEEGLCRTMRAVDEQLRGRTLHILAGGPPCQGYSTAGKWSLVDRRNALAQTMVTCASVLRPDHVLIENVPGIIIQDGGSHLSRLVEGLKRAEYSVSILTLKAEQYGVPQRRRRVFLVCCRENDAPDTPPPSFAPAPSRRARNRKRPAPSDLPPPVTVRDAIGDLPPVESGGGLPVIEYNTGWISSEYQALMRGMVSVEQFKNREWTMN